MRISDWSSDVCSSDLEGKGPKPTAEDMVKVHYKGELLDGTQFDSSHERGEPAVFALQQVAPGWAEGVQLMAVGSRSEERRVGKERVRKGRSRWSQYI